MYAMPAELFAFGLSVKHEYVTVDYIDGVTIFVLRNRLIK